MELRARIYTSLKISSPDSCARYSMITPIRKRKACMLTKKPIESRLMLFQTKIVIMIQILQAMASSRLHLFATGCIPRVTLEAREAHEVDNPGG